MTSLSDLTPAERREYDRRIAEVQAGFDRQLASVQADCDKMRQQLGNMLLGRALREVADGCGVLPGAVDDVMLRASDTIKMDNGVPVVMDGGKPALDSAGKPVSVAAWVSGLIETAPHLFSKQALRAHSGQEQADFDRTFINNVEKISDGRMRLKPPPVREEPYRRPTDAEVLAMAGGQRGPHDDGAA